MKAVVFAILLCLLGCTAQSGPSHASWFEKNGKLKVISTTAMIDDLTREIGREYIDHSILILGDIDPHSYELVKGDDEKISFADVVIANGLNLEHGASLRHKLEKHPHILYLGEEIQKKAPLLILTVDGQLDPHLWMDISLWTEGVDSIVEMFSKLDPDHAQFYKENGESLRAKMLTEHEKIKGYLAKVPAEKRYLVTSHDAFNYFTRAYLAENGEWKGRFMAPEGLAPEGQLSCLDIQRVVDHLTRYHIDVIFPESNVSRDALKKIISSSKHKVRISSHALYGDAMGSPGHQASSYLGMIEYNAKVLIEEWTK